MKITILKHCLNNAPLKIMAGIFGYAFWSLMSMNYTTQRWLELPLCFYKTPSDLIIQAPETISVAISGSRVDLAHLDTSRLAVHIDTHAMSAGTHTISPTHEHLLLPTTFKITHWIPSNLVITLQKQSSTDERVS